MEPHVVHTNIRHCLFFQYVPIVRRVTTGVYGGAMMVYRQVRSILSVFYVTGNPVKLV